MVIEGEWNSVNVGFFVLTFVVRSLGRFLGRDVCLLLRCQCSSFFFSSLGSDSFSSFGLYYLRTVIRFMEVVTVQQNVRSSLELNGY